MITQITVERLYNLGNYENLRLAATAQVETGDPADAFAEARAAVEAHYAAFQAEREAAERRQREEYEAERERQRAERAARQTPTLPAHDDGDAEF